MLGLEYLLALIKVLFQVGFAIVSAIPFHLAWNGVAPKYLYFLPDVYHHVGYWAMVGLILVSMFLGDIVGRLSPKLVKVSTSSDAKTEA